MFERAKLGLKGRILSYSVHSLKTVIFKYTQGVGQLMPKSVIYYLNGP